MIAMPSWIVHQKRPATGCIPTGFEMLLRAAKVGGVDFSTFQDEFDLDLNAPPFLNHFISVGDAVTKKYPNVKFACVTFPKGEGCLKLAKVREMLQQGRPVLVSLAHGPRGPWHIMPVLAEEGGDLVLLEHVDSQGTPVVKRVNVATFVAIHDKWQGGEEISFLESF